MIVGVILAGGLSTRMGGGDKPLLPVGGRPILAHVIERLGPQVERLALNANGDPGRFARFGLPVLPDSIPGYAGPLAGVLAGMDWAAGLGADAIVTAAGDTPFFPDDLVASLRRAALAEGKPLAIAVTPGAERHPTFGLWPVALREDLRSALERGMRRVLDWTEAKGAARAVFRERDAFFNVNAPTDLARAQVMHDARSHAPFDTVAIVDWSSRSSPSPPRPSPDAIWIAVEPSGSGPRYFRTRAAALNWLGDLLARESAAGRRVLVGFDFPFGYPRGFAAALTGRAEALAVWGLLATMVRDATDNANNRFDVAAALNARFADGGPFWGRPAGRDLPTLPQQRRGRSHGLPEGRLVEARVRSAQSPWKLYTVGSAGGQALTGLPALQRLRRDPRLDRITVWPFETGLLAPRSPIVLAEVYPSLLAARIRAERRDGEILDAAQVRVTARALASLGAAGGLGGLFEAAADLTPEERAIVAREEGWILGAAHEAALRAAAAEGGDG